MRRVVPLTAAVLALSVCQMASGQCAFINFENLPVDTEVTTQYPGITFSARTSVGNPTYPPRIFPAGNNTSSPSRALRRTGTGSTSSRAITCAWISRWISNWSPSPSA